MWNNIINVRRPLLNRQRRQYSHSALTLAFLLTLATALINPSHATTAPAYKGISYTSFGADVLASSASDTSLLNASLVGTDTVALNFWWFQPTTTSNSMAPDYNRYSSTLSSVSHAIDTIHNLGMKVLLKPMLDVADASGTWRAYIDPSDKDVWFNNYTNYIGSFADLAQSKGVELFSIGCEMNTLEQSINDARWSNLISNVRSRYNGKLTYSANFSPLGVNVGGYQNVPWWNQLDYIGIDAYFPVATQNNTTLAGLTAAWQNQASAIETWRSTSNLTNKQVLFTEVGYQSADGSAKTPWDVGSTPIIDLQEQADAYHALLSVMTTKTWWDGAFWWNWETNPYAGGSSDAGFTPQNKPAQAILQQYYGGPGPPPPPHGAPTQQLFSWETGLQNWAVPNFAGKPAAVQQALTGATSGQHSLAIGQTGGGFSWDAFATLTGDALTAFSLALADNPANYRLEFDVTYSTASIPQGSVTYLNESFAINNTAGNWTQVDNIAPTNGRTNQTVHVALPLTSWAGLTAGSSSYTFYLALSGNWGTSQATVFFDNLRLVNLLAPITGDSNSDGSVDAADYVLWRNTVGSTTDLRADANLNGIVDAPDYQLWRSSFQPATPGLGTSAADAVPEPATCLLLALATLAIRLRSRAIIK